MKYLHLDIPDKMFGLDTALMMIFVPPILVAAAAVIMFNLVIVPRINDYQTMLKNNQTIVATTAALNEKVAYLDSISQSDLQKNENLVTSAILPQKNAYYLVNVIRKVADKYNFRVDSFSVQLGKISQDSTADTSVKGYAQIPVVLTLVGPHDGYYDLINGLERSLPVLSLQNFQMSVVEGVATINLTVNGFYISEAKIVQADKLTMADLTLTKDESDLVAQLTQFDLVQDLTGIEGGFNTTGQQFVKYDRTDPFNQ